MLDVETLIARSVERFKAGLGWKANFIDADDIKAYEDEIRRVIQEARKP